MRRSEGAFALIREIENGRPVVLTQWNRHWAAYNFVGGHRKPGESFLHCLIREIGEELELLPGPDFSVADQPCAVMEYEATSGRTREPTEYTIHVFEVRLAGAKARDSVDSNPLNRWIPIAEARSGMTADGKAVSDTLVRVLDHLDATR